MGINTKDKKFYTDRGKLNKILNFGNVPQDVAKFKFVCGKDKYGQYI